MSERGATEGRRGRGTRPGLAALVRALPGGRPELAAGVVVLPTATVVGRVRLGARSSIWYGAVLRGDTEEIRVGADSNVQDGAVLHADAGFPMVVGDRVTVGHAAVLHGAIVEDDCIIGMGAILLNGAHIARGCIVGAGAVLRQNQAVPAGSLVAGSPAAVKRAVTGEETALIDRSWREYVELARMHQAAAEP
jgi:carbonic anhydrase/acetyltransferase-like protein (isoleucine patch superfamily)